MVVICYDVECVSKIVIMCFLWFSFLISQVINIVTYHIIPYYKPSCAEQESL